MTTAELAVEDLSVSYGRVRALRGVSLELRKGEIVCLLGANGAGKSTLLNTIAGLQRGDSGVLRYGGRNIAEASPWTLVSEGLAQVPEGRQVFPSLTVDEHLQLAFIDKETDNRKFSIPDIYEIFPRLLERKEVMAGNLSGGEQQMLVVGRALVTQPRVLLLDEPSLGLSPKLAQTVIHATAKLRDRGLSVLLVEQNASLALSVSDRAYVLASGQITASGTVDELSSSDEIRRAYLGEQV